MFFGVVSCWAPHSLHIHFSLTLSLKVQLFSLLASLKRAAVLCRQRAPLLLTLQASNKFNPFVPLLCFLTASRCGEWRHDTKHYVCSSCFVQQRNFLSFLCFVSSNFTQNSFQVAFILHD